VNHLGKQALTNNSSTILKEIDVVHPAAKLLVMASQQQEAEVYPFEKEVFTLAR
jgi:T-complex protein 1 subunit theta